MIVTIVLFYQVIIITMIFIFEYWMRMISMIMIRVIMITVMMMILSACLQNKIHHA